MLNYLNEPGKLSDGSGSRSQEFQKTPSGLPLISSNLYIFSLISVQIIKGAHHSRRS